MKFLLFTLGVIFSAASFAQTTVTIQSPNSSTQVTVDPNLPNVILESGSSYICSQIRQQVICQQEIKKKCFVRHNYVGKNYYVTMPNEKKYGTYRTKHKALAKAQSLVNMKICEELEIDFEFKDDDKGS